MSAPSFLNKPKHKDNVIATPRGWAVEKTGELLVSVKNLDQRIAEHLGMSTFKFEPTPEVVSDNRTMAAPVETFSDTTLPALWKGAHTGPDAVIVPLSANTAIDSLLDSLDTSKADVVVEDIVEAVAESTEAPVDKPKSKRGGYRPRKPKVTE